MHRMRCDFACLLTRIGLILAAVVTATATITTTPAAADLIRPTASQSFPDLDGDIAATQTYHYDPNTQTGTFQVNSAPTLLATGPNSSSEYVLNDTTSGPRNETLQIKLDANGNLLAGNPANSFSLYGSVTINGTNYNGLLLQGTPTQFGYAKQSSSAPTMSVYDLNMTVTGGLLKGMYTLDPTKVPVAYMRVITETNSTFHDSFSQDFNGTKAMTNVRAYPGSQPLPAAAPEPSSLVIVAVCAGVGWAFLRWKKASTASPLS
jgi:hypothetical protein